MPKGYKRTTRIGSACRVNGKDVFALFDADLKEIKTEPAVVSATYRKKAGLSGLRKTSFEYGAGTLQLTFYVGGASKEEAFRNTAGLIAECEQCTVAVDEDSFEYDAIISDTPKVTETKVPFYNEVVMVFACIKRHPLVTRVFDGGFGTFYNVGLLESGLRIKIVPTKAIASLTVAGITVKNLVANRTFVIDGIEGKVECLGVNSFMDTDLIEFPKVVPGENKITSSTSVKIEVEYYPVFPV